MIVFWVATNGRHPNTTQCVQGAYQKWHRLLEEEARAYTETVFRLYGYPITKVVSFKYLGHNQMAS